MPFYTYSGSWRNIKKAWLYANNAWQPIKKGWVYVSNAWRLFFSGENVPSIQQQVTISQTTDSDGYVTLTGTNYHWTNYQTLTYYFEWSQDGGSTWSIINTGSITNPSSGSSNTKTYIVSLTDTAPNIDNLYRFRVFAQNITLTNSSTSGSTTISTPRNITISFYSKTYNSITVEFTTPAYAGSYNIRIGSSTYQPTLGTAVGGNTRVTATGLSSSTLYSIRVTPYTGGLGLFGGTVYVKGYPGNESNAVTVTTDDPPTPVQTDAPDIPTGNPIPFSQVTIGAGGTYNNRTSVTSSLVKILQGTTITAGGTTALGTVVSSPYTVTQSDATITKFNFYTRDNVVGLNGTTYYWYSPALISFLGTITDNYNRVSGTGLGISSSGYDYNSYNINPTTWSTNGSVAVSSQSIPSGTTNSANFAMDTFETNSANNSISLAAHGAVPSGSLAGYGASVWVTSSNSWYAVISTYDYATFTDTVATCTSATCCNAGCCPASCAGCIFKFNVSGVTCTGSGTHQTTTSTTPNCTGFTDSCGGCTLSSTETRYNYSIRGQEDSTTYAYSEWQISKTYGFCRPVGQEPPCPSCPGGTTTYVLSGCGSGSWRCECTINSCVAVTGQPSCPEYSSTPSAGARCSTANCTSTTTTTYPCVGSVTNDTSCPSLGSGFGGRCSDCTTSTVYNWTFPKNVAYSCDVYEYGVSGTSTTSGYNYNTRLQLVSSVSGTVSYPAWDTNTTGIIKTNKVAGALNESNFIRATGLVVNTSGNTITANGSNANNDTFTELTKANVTISKTEADGSSSAGVIKGYTERLTSEGRIDSLQIN